MKLREFIAAFIALVSVGVGCYFVLVGRGMQAMLFAGEYGHQAYRNIVYGIGMLGLDGDENLAVG